VRIKLHILFILLFSTSVFAQQEEQGLIYEDLYLKNAEKTKLAYDYSKKYYYIEKTKEKNAYHDSLLRALDDIKFTCNAVQKEKDLDKELKTLHKEIIKKIDATDKRARSLKTMPSGDTKSTHMEKLIFSCGELVNDVYYAYLIYTKEKVNKKAKAPKNANQIDSLELLKTDKGTLFTFMKDYIKYNSILAINIKETEKMLKSGLTPQEKQTAMEDLEFMRLEKVKNDRLLFLVVERLNEVRGKIIETVLIQNNLKEEFVLFDKDADGKIDMEEVYTAIEEFLDGKISISPLVIYNLIDFYLDSE
jgi:hypothetical protein